MLHAITGYSIVSPIGHDTETSCVSYRAGIVRPITLHDFQVLEIEDLESTSVIGYPITGLTNGFRGIGLSMRLMELAIGELLLGISKIKNFDSTILSEASLFICFSKCREENFEFYDEILKQTLIRSVTDIFNVPFNESHHQFFSVSNASVLTATQKAVELIDKNFN